ncbi:MAG: hypothetical protein U0R19_02370 [Bryobacteraceae bacterium]
MQESAARHAFFAAASAVSQALANADVGYGGFMSCMAPQISGSTQEFLGAVGQDLLQLNRSAAADIQSGKMSGPDLLSALYRILNLKLVTDKQFQEMKQMDADGVGRAVAELLGLVELSADENVTAFYRRYLVLALEAYRREKISHRKLVEIGDKLGVGADEIELILTKLGLDQEPASVLLPR